MTNEQIAQSALLTKNQTTLKWEEDKMRTSLKSYAESLKYIRESKCWKIHGDPYESFDDYCRKKLGFGEKRASQIITATDVMYLMAETVQDQPEMVAKIEALPESVFRELKDVTPEKAVEIVREIGEKGKVTSTEVRKATKPINFVPEKRVPLKFTPSQWVDVGRKCPLFLSWWEHLSATEQEEVLAYLKSKP